MHFDYVYSSTCPCSLELSEHARESRGQLATPHSQRSVARISAVMEGEEKLWFEDMVALCRRAVATETQVMVKREDEQAFAELNAANPIFVEDAVRALGVQDVEVRSTLTPPWTTDWINADARERLRQYGIAPPAPAGEGLITLEAEPTRCPRCGSFDVNLTASFGSTLCKRLYVCGSCKEPFEGLKSV